MLAIKVEIFDPIPVPKAIETIAKKVSPAPIASTNFFAKAGE